MNKKEKEILKKTLSNSDGLLSGSSLISGIANSDKRSVNNLIAERYIEEVPQEIDGRTSTFYRITEKGLVEFNYLRKIIYKIKNNTGLVIGLLSIVVSIFIALYVPYYQYNINKENSIQALYKDILTNGDIFISNTDNLEEFAKDKKLEKLPEFFIISNTNEDTRKLLQKKFGLVQYRWFLYYLQQTELLNSQIKLIKEKISAGEDTEIAINNYVNAMHYLSFTDVSTKFNYVYDTECIYHFFEETFSYLDIDPRGKAMCGQDSVKRLVYNFGYVSVDTPAWLINQIKEVIELNNAELIDAVNY